MKLPLRTVGAVWLLVQFAGRPLPAANPPAAPAEAAMTADGPALLREWIPAVYPPAALKARRSGMVTVRFIVDPAGQVIQARALDDSDEEFVEPALAAVRAWVFTPAMEKGEPVACCLETLMAFSPAQGQRKPSPRKIPPEDQILQLAPRTSPQPRATPEGEYPGVLQSRQLEGAVAFRCRVSPEGRVLQTRILDATHADFVVPALAALEQWEFSPAMQGDLPVEADVEARINFTTIVGKPADVLAANGITAPDGRPPDVTPELMVATDPVWPAERLLQGEGGSATVEFTVRERGAVRNVRMIEASHPEFGYALAAAVETWHFSPPLLNGRGTTVTLRKRAEFGPGSSEGAASPPVLRVAEAVRAGEVSGAKGLDERLTPLYQVPPTYPAVLAAGDRPTGRAEIEFVIDRTGRARLPRIVSATHEEFGWAAATAIAQWVFRPPTRGGEPVDVRVKIPMDFRPPD